MAELWKSFSFPAPNGAPIFRELGQDREQTSDLLCALISPPGRILFLPGLKGEGEILEEVWNSIFLSPGEM